jgi:hypothetical protein
VKNVTAYSICDSNRQQICKLLMRLCTGIKTKHGTICGHGVAGVSYSQTGATQDSRRTSTYCFGASEKGLAADSLHYMSVDPKASEECDGL